MYRLCIILSIFLFSTIYAQKLPKVIVFSKTEGYRHQSIKYGVKSIKKLGKENQFSVQATENANELILALKSCKVVIFLSTTGNILNNAQQKEFKKYINNGGGFVGIHAAADTEYKWSWYGNMLGAYFKNHPKQQEAKIDILNRQHLATHFLSEEWAKFDEWYNYKNINPNINILLNLDEKSYTGGENGKNHPIAWFHKFEGGNIFYTGLGHTKESYQNSTFLKHILGGIQYAMGLDNELHKKETQSKNKWKSLFNGKDLTNWIVKIKGYPLQKNYKNTFRVENGVLKVSYDGYETFNASYGHLFYKNPHSNYKLRLQYRFTGKQVKGGAGWAKRNSGVMIHSQSPQSMGLDQGFPVSLEVQLLGGVEEGVERPTGNLCTPGTHVIMDGELITDHCINSTSKTFYGEEWVNLEILVLKDSLISHIINGKEVIRYTKPSLGGEYSIDTEEWKLRKGKLLDSGYIALQSESHPIEFRKIELLELGF